MPTITKAQERQRRVSLIAMYVLGVGVGCVLVGVMLKAKRAVLAPNAPPTTSAPAGPPLSTPMGSETPPAPAGTGR